MSIKNILLSTTILVILGAHYVGIINADDNLYDRIPIFVSIPPLKYLVDSIGGGYVDVHVMVPPGQDPHEYEPEPRKILQLGKAKIYFEIGMPFEKIITEKIRESGLKTMIVNSAFGVNTILQDEKSSDLHIWLSPALLKTIANNIYRALSSVDVKHKGEYDLNYLNTLLKINDVERKISVKLRDYRGKSFLIYHPVLGYFANDFGLCQIPIENEGKSPTPRELLNIISVAKAMKINTVFVEPQYNKNSAEAVAKAIDGKIVVIDDLAENVLDNLECISEQLKESFK